MGYEALARRLSWELYAFFQLLSGDLTTPIVHCRGWTLHDLAEHVGAGNVWAATAITRQRGDIGVRAAPREPDRLREWFEKTCERLLEAITLPATKEAWTIAPPFTVGFWRRRRCLEMVVHRWDAERALGIPSELRTDACAEAVAEVIDTIAPRQVRLGRMDEPDFAVRFVATDVVPARKVGSGGGTRTIASTSVFTSADIFSSLFGEAALLARTGPKAGAAGSWDFGPGEPVAIVRGTAADLMLMLWHRLPVDDPAIAWEGDDAGLMAARRLIMGPLVP